MQVPEPIPAEHLDPTSSNHVVDGATYIASAWIGGSQRTDGNEEIVLDVHLPNIHNSGSSHSRCSCPFVTLNGTNRSSRTWMLTATIGKVLGSLKWSHANNTNVGGGSGHEGENIGQLEVMRQGIINRNVSNKMEHERLGGTIVSTMEIAKKASHKISIA